MKLKIKKKFIVFIKKECIVSDSEWYNENRSGKMKKKWKLLVAILCVVVAGVACEKKITKEPHGINDTKEDKKTDVGQAKIDTVRPIAYGNVSGLTLEKGTYLSVIGKSDNSSYWKEVEKGAKRAAQDINTMLGYSGDDKVKVTYSGPSDESKVDEQINILDEELARYPAAVNIAVIDASACQVQFDLATENDIPIIGFDSGSNYQGVTLCTTNNADAAKTVAVKLGTAIDNQGELALFVHDSVSTTAKERESAFLNEIQQNHPEIEVVSVYHLDELTTMAQQITEEKNATLTENEKVVAEDITQDDVMDYILEKHPNIKGCMATNQETTQLMVEACERAKKENVILMGFDGGEEQLKSLQDEKLAGVIMQNPYGMGYATIIASARAVLGLGNEAIIDTGYIWVTKENLGKDAIKKMLY